MIDSPKLKKTCRPATYKGLALIDPIDDRTLVDNTNNTIPISSQPTFSLASNPLFLNLDLAIHLKTDRSSEFIYSLQSEFDTWLRAKLNRVDTRYNKSLDTIVANLWDAHQSSSQLITPLRRVSIAHNNSDKISYKMITNTLKFLSDQEYIKLNKGQAGEQTGIASWSTSTPKLSRFFELSEMQTKLKENATFVVLRKKLPVETVVTKSRTVGDDIEFYEAPATVKHNVDVPIPSSQKAKARRLAKTVRAYNQLWTNSSATLNGYHIRPWCRRIFNNNLNLGGRYYGEFQTLPKVDRAKILINDFPTIEPDYSGLHFNLLYAQEGIQLHSGDDVYKVRGYARSTIKAVMLVLLNTTKLNTLAGNITTSGYRHIKQANEAYGLGKGNGFIEGIPDGTDGHDLLAKLKQRHHAIAHRFGEADLGIKLQHQDSILMSKVLDVLIANNIAALPIHDSIRVQVHQAGFAVATMKEQYQLLTGHSIEVSSGMDAKPRTLRACRG